MNEFDWKYLIELHKKLDCKVRLGIRATGESTEWSASLIEPSPSYVEIPSYGPVKKSDVEFVELDPIIVAHVGRLIPDNKRDVEADLVQELRRRSITFEKIGSYIRITL